MNTDNSTSLMMIIKKCSYSATAELNINLFKFKFKYIIT